jgi:hypothetical protein
VTQPNPQYDFYATPVATAPTPSAVGTAPSAPAFGAGGPVNQFGTPLGVPGATLPARAGAAVPAARGSGVRLPGWVWRLGLGLAVAVVLGLFGIGRMGFLDVFHGPLEAPTTLGGMGVVTETSPVRTALAPLTAQMQGQVGDDAVIEVYTDGVSRVALLVAARGEEDVDDGVTAMAAAGYALTDVGGSRCATSTAEGTSMCMVAQDGVTAVVLLSGTDPAAAAALVSEAVSGLD